jgi:IS1 family transposase/transposase-like protein
MLSIQSTLICPRCSGTNIIKNGHKAVGKQNYRCKSCGRQFIGDAALTYLGCHSGLTKKIEKMLVRGCGIRDIAAIEGVSRGKVLCVLVNSVREIRPKQSYYDRLALDEFWTYVGSKAQKVWLIYAYHRESGEIVAWVWGKRNAHTARKLRQKLADLGVQVGCIQTDDWKSFKKVFGQDNHQVGKIYTRGIEGNNCRLRHRIRRAVRKTCNFSKKLLNHCLAFELAFFYINFGFV